MAIGSLLAHSHRYAAAVSILRNIQIHTYPFYRSM